MTEKVTVEGGAGAFDQGLFKVGELSPKSNGVIEYITAAPSPKPGIPFVNPNGDVDIFAAT